MGVVNDCQVSSKTELHSNYMYLKLKSRQQGHGQLFVRSDDSIVILNVKEQARIGQKTALAHYASTRRQCMLGTVARYALKPFMAGTVG